MLDYKLLAALDAVVRDGSFEQAARSLNITQSAVSQRIKQLERVAGQVLLVRASPPRLHREQLARAPVEPSAVTLATAKLLTGNGSEHVPSIAGKHMHACDDNRP